jgi:hypothetical protein
MTNRFEVQTLAAPVTPETTTMPAVQKRQYFDHREDARVVARELRMGGTPVLLLCHSAESGYTMLDPLAEYGDDANLQQRMADDRYSAAHRLSDARLFSPVGIDGQ